MMPKYRVAVDTGGTFTDLCLVDDSTGKLAVAKVSSTPSDPSAGVINGVQKLMSMAGFQAEEIGFFLHGTTVATNALLEGKGAATSLITTEGFEDVLLIGRQNRPKLYDFWAKRPRPIVPRSLCYGAPERTLHTGEILRPLDEARVREIIVDIRRKGIKSIAVCLLHSYANPDHERRIKAILEDTYPEAFVTVSSDILPEYREYERMSTVCINAYVMPKVNSYIKHLESRLRQMGVASGLYIMQSNGGVITAQMAREASARTVLSGPAGGALTGAYLSKNPEYPNVITIDIGGTSSDICLIKDGKPNLTTESDIEGYPIKLPMIDINTIGAGGGSIAWIDPGGALRVGPQSAGADPGPACYGLGGKEPTVTDANAVLGRINPSFLLGGEMPLHLEKAQEVIEEKIAGPLGIDLVRAAEGIITVVNANMIRGIRRVSVEKGYDPRDFALVAFGGAGPLHGVELAGALNMKRVIVPLYPGIASAFGMLSADVRHDYVQTKIGIADQLNLEELNTLYREMESHAVRQLAVEGFHGSKVELLRRVDMRYVGQSYELSIPAPARPITAEIISTLIDDYHRSHEQAYGYARQGEKVEVVNLRLVALGKLPRSEIVGKWPSHGTPPQPVGHRPVLFEGQFHRTPIYQRDHLLRGRPLPGPVIIEQLDSTTVVPPGSRAAVEPGGNILIDLGEV
jgi:N-methylhydantoinase A